MGVITARFATFDVVDLDGDVIRPGSVGEQAVNAGLYNHVLAGPTPAGYGDAYEEDGAAYSRNTYLLNTYAGRETYTYLKAMADAGRPVEWSFVFYVEDGNELDTEDPLYEEVERFFGMSGPYEIKAMDIISVDPVGRGAGIDTATVDAKDCGPACEARRASEGLSRTLSLDIDYSKLADAIAEAISRPAAASIPEAAKGRDNCGCDAKGLKSRVAGANGENLAAKGQQLGDLIRELRDERGLSNDDLADAAGISVSTVGQIIAGTIFCPPVARLQRIARRLNVNLSRLIAAAEQDGCDRYDETDVEEASADAASEAKAEEALEGADELEAKGASDYEDAAALQPSIQHQIDTIMTGFPGLPPEDDPGMAAYQRYLTVVSSIEEM